MLSTNQINQVYALLKKVSQYQKTQHRSLFLSDIEEKSLNQLVSHVDINSEKMLVEGLQRITPKAAFLTEEGTIEQADSDLLWIIDPLDGTTNYIFGHYQYAISIALQRDGETVFGVVGLPAEDEYYMSNGKGALLNNSAIYMKDPRKLEDSLIATGFPYYDFKELDDYLEVLKRLMRMTKGLRRMGSAAIDLAYTADSKFNAFFELNLSPWDVAAGAFIVEQAGGVVMDFNGGRDFIYGRSIIAGTKEVVPLLHDIITECVNT